MKIYTKTGDTGETSLFGGTRISKADTRIEAYGCVDELNSYIGWLGDQEINGSRKSLLQEIQNILFAIGAQLAVSPGKNNLKTPKLFDADVTTLELEIDHMETQLEPLRNFILPGGHPSVSFCHIARCVCRRAERAVIRLHQAEKVENLLLIYLNRLSDYLFVLGRMMAKDLHIKETIWTSRD